MRGRLIHRIWRAKSDSLAPRRFRSDCSYDAFVPERIDVSRISLPMDIAADLSEAEAAIQQMQEHGGLLLDPLTHLLMRTESIASSRIEGIQVDARELARAEAKQRVGRRAGARAREVIKNIEAMQFAIRDAARVDRLSTRELLSVHDLLMRGQIASAGRLRTVQNWIGGNDHNPCGADYVPPPVEFVAELMDDLCVFCDSDEAPSLFQAAIAHAQFETIHPFDDGNGRTGRALIHIVLRRRGLAPRFVPPISVALSRSPNAYIQGLSAFRDGDLETWLLGFVTAVRQSLQVADQYMTSVIDLMGEWRHRLREGGNPRRHATAWKILDALPGYPVLNRADAVELADRSLPAVDHALRQLEGAGVLIPVRYDSPSRRSWEPAGLLDLITALESGESISPRA